MDRKLLEEQLRALPLVQYEFFPTDTLVFTPRVRTVCEMECPQYGKSWACPPGVGTVEEMPGAVPCLPGGAADRDHDGGGGYCGYHRHSCHPGGP